MKAKNLTPFPFGTKVTSRRARRLEMTLIVRACYVLAPGKPLALPEGPPVLAQGTMSADTYREEDAERAGECLYPGDFADWKSRAEVMLRGTCHTPAGKPVGECPVRFSVGRWSKTLQVVGRRLWTDDTRTAAITRPTPFTTMPVDYAHAFGGSEYPRNPAGQGFAGRELPNVEHARNVIAARRDDPGPSSFGPINPAWPQRAAKVGKKYDAAWKKNRFPFFAEDFDWTYFNAAPADQQLEGYLRGDESLTFQNLHPAQALFQASLPGLRIRAFVKDVEARFREVAMNLDTLFVDLDEGKLYLTWRGLDPIKTDDMKDVLWALVASEKLDEEPRTANHYRERLEAFEADPLEIKERVPGDLLEKFDEMQARQQARAEGRPVSKHDAPPPDPMTANVRALLDKMPVALPDAKGIESKVADAVAAAIARAPKVDVKGQIASAANDMARTLASPKIPAFPLRAGGPPPAWAAKGFQQALDQLERVKTLGVDRKLPEAEQEQLQKEIAKAEAQVEELKKDPFFQRILNRPPYEEPGPGKDLRGQDYEGRDLHGRDLRGANLEDANLAGANLAGANLSVANLEAAVLCGADLTGADLTGANLTLANLTSVRAPGAIFRRTKLDRAFLQKADLSRAVFEGAAGDFVFFPDADLTEADCHELSLQRSYAKGAKLAGANFYAVSLVRCLFLECAAEKVKLARALLTRTSFARSDLTGADLSDARGEQSVWMGAKLHEASFARAVLPHARFMDASAVRASFRRAVLKDARCYRSSFEHADFTESQLFGIELTRCSLKRARFNGACLYGAKFRQASGGGCDFSGANMTRAVLQDA